MSTRRRFLCQVAATTFYVGCQPVVRRRQGESREVIKVAPAEARVDGAGVHLHRALGGTALPMLDPFLLLDEIHSDRKEDWSGGFPTHPHRGFETVSYLLEGRFEHADSVGNRGVIGPGACQWMTAGRGILHQEMPRQEDGKMLRGLQLWVNLPAAEKMKAPRYQELGASDIETLSGGEAEVRLIAGVVGRKRGPVDGISIQPTFLDLSLPAGGVHHQPVAQAEAAFLYVLDGEVEVGARGSVIPSKRAAVLGEGRDVYISSRHGGRALLLAASPLREPVARRGPFVMNTEAEIRQAILDYQNGTLAI